MTSTEWVQIKKRLSDKENQLIKSLAPYKGQPQERVADEGESASYTKSDGTKMVVTPRGRIIEEIAEVQRVRRELKPGRRRW